MISVPIRRRSAEKGLFLQKLQHAIPSIVVLGDGLDHLSHNPSGAELALGVFEVAAAMLVMGSVVIGLRKLRKKAAHEVPHPHHGVDWIDICIGLMLGVEAYAKYHSTHHIPRPTIVLALAMITIGLAHPRIAAWGERRRHLRVSAEGISLPVKPFSRMNLAWVDVAEITINDRYAAVIATDGRQQRFEFADLTHGPALRDALMQANTFLDEARYAARSSIESTTHDA